MTNTHKRVHELRHYTATPGRGPAMIDRFLARTMPILERLSITVLDTWTLPDEPDQMVYLVEWNNLDQMNTMWATFSADPEWQIVKDETEHNGPLVGTIIRTTMHPTTTCREETCLS